MPYTPPGDARGTKRRECGRVLQTQHPTHRRTHEHPESRGEPPPNEWTPVVGSESQEVSDGRTSTSVVYGRLQAASGRSCGIKWPLDRISGERTRPARFCIASLGRTTWRRARADGGVAAPHNAGDAAVGGPRCGDRSFATRERAIAHGARHFKKLSSAAARLCGLETALCSPWP